MSNALPTQPANDSATKVKKFFNDYYDEPLSFPVNQVDAVVGFFEKRDFDKQAAIAVSGSLLQQAKIDNVNVFKLLDTLKTLERVQLSALVTEVLNFDRPSSSTLGYKTPTQSELSETRNIIL
jgi:hypothetical protein|tara:strand:+ start:367 stop:735 length:369 start_codon:yes stop_codon:yes gene_type:complete